MSRERARRREEREKERAGRINAAEGRERVRRERSARKSRIKNRLYINFTPGELARRRRRKSMLVLLMLIVVNLFVWLFEPTFFARLGAIVITLLLLPLIRTLYIEQRD